MSHPFKYDSVEEHLYKFPRHRDMILKLSSYIDNVVRVVSADDEELNFPIGTTGVIVGFDREIHDGLILETADGKLDLVYPAEIERV